ncbi:MAG TPA: HAD family phosphatase [Mycobacteriales bacterium]|nr:HAD family phosphatase [Mycobacteriales bacterium]
MTPRPDKSRCAEAVLFDMDGLLVDTEPLWTVAEIELAHELGGEWDLEIKAEIVGTRLDVAVPRVLRHYGHEDTPQAIAKASAFLLDRMVQLFDADLPLHDGALGLIDAVRARGVPTALVSSSFRVLVDAALHGLGEHRFDFTLAGDEVRHGKPDPEPYLVACERLAVKPDRCVVLEDAMSGVRSAEAAGCTVVAVPFVTAIPPDPPRRHVVTSLPHIDTDWLLALPCS